MVKYRKMCPVQIAALKFFKPWYMFEVSLSNVVKGDQISSGLWQDEIAPTEPTLSEIKIEVVVWSLNHPATESDQQQLKEGGQQLQERRFPGRTSSLPTTSGLRSGSSLHHTRQVNLPWKTVFVAWRSRAPTDGRAGVEIPRFSM